MCACCVWQCTVLMSNEYIYRGVGVSIKCVLHYFNSIFFFLLPLLWVCIDSLVQFDFVPFVNCEGWIVNRVWKIQNRVRRYDSGTRERNQFNSVSMQNKKTRIHTCTHTTNSQFPVVICTSIHANISLAHSISLSLTPVLSCKGCYGGSKPK